MTPPKDEGPASRGMGAGPSQDLAAAKPLVPDAQSSRDEAAQAAVDAADPWAVAAWRTAIRYLASTGVPFTVDDGHALGAPMPDHPNALGGLFIAAAQAGEIKPVGYRPSRRRSRRQGVQRVWVGGPPR
jgi:hypothetical protein